MSEITKERPYYFSSVFSQVLLVALTATFLVTGISFFPKIARAEEPSGMCPLQPQADRFIVDFGDLKIWSSGSLSNAFVSASTSISSGQYRITLVSSDSYPDRVNVTQPNERWYLILKDALGVVGQTNSTTDLPDLVASATTTDVVSENFEVSRAVNLAIAFHAVYPDTSNPNSVFPVCAVLDKLPPLPPPPHPMYLPQMPACSGNFGTITEISNPSSFYSGYNYDEIPEHYVVVQNATSTHGNNLDWYWVQEWSPEYIEWDLGELTDQVRIYPSQDHGPYPAEFDEFDVRVSAERINWITLASSTTYVGDINNVKTHDGVKDYSATSTFRYVRIAPNASGGGDYEIDAVQNCPLPPPDPLPNNPPVITLLGDNPLRLKKDTPFSDPGASAQDAEDGNITSRIKIGGDTVDTSHTGTFFFTYNVTDSQGASAPEVKRTIIVETEQGGGGGGGGGSTPPANGPIISPPPNPSAPTTTQPAPQCNYLLEYLRIGQNNNPVEVRKLQAFLRDYEGFTNLGVTGFFDQPTFDAVSVFQRKYFDDVLGPWGLEGSTGYVYITTKKKINELYCQREFPLTLEQQREISAYRSRMEALRQTAPEVRPGVKEEVGLLTPSETTATTTSTIFSGIDIAGLVISPVQGVEETRSAASTFICDLASNNKIWDLLGIILFVLLVLFLYRWQRKKTEIQKPESPVPLWDEYGDYGETQTPI